MTRKKPDSPSENLPDGVHPADTIPVALPVPDYSSAHGLSRERARAQLVRANAEDVLADVKPLTPEQQAYCVEYAASADHARARAAAGWTVTEAKLQRVRPQVQAGIQRARAAVQATYLASTDELIAELQRIALGDARELVSYVYDPCPACWPDERAAETHLPPTPDPDCENCRGAGVGSTRVRDTRDLSESGRALFAGIKQTQHGTYVLMHSKMDAMEKLLKIYGAYDLDNRQKLAPLAELLEYVAANRQALPIRK